MKYDITFKKTVTIEANNPKEALDRAEKAVEKVHIWTVDVKTPQKTED